MKCRRPQFHSWVGKICWRKDRLPTPVFLDFPDGSAGKESICNAGDLGLIPGLGRSPGEGNSDPLQYSGLEKSMDCIAHRVAKYINTYVYMYWYIHTHGDREKKWARQFNPNAFEDPILEACTRLTWTSRSLSAQHPPLKFTSLWFQLPLSCFTS